MTAERSVTLPPFLPQASLAHWLDLLRRRELCAVEAVDLAISRIEAGDARLNAVITRRFEAARAEAAEADVARGRGDARPLLGVPITVKESFDVAGLPTTWGVPGPARAAQRDAVAVARLRAAGAIVLGKSNVPTMLADWQTSNPLHGRTSNPWNLGRTPGGSSGGGAAALAAGYVPLELGSDLGGSLRVPAHCCGVYAHKPSHGLVPLRGAAPPGAPRLGVSAPVPFAVAGPMARSASDLALALDLLAGPDDAEAVAWRLALPPARHPTLAAHRVLVLGDHPLLPNGDEVRAAFEALALRLEGAGCRVERTSPALPDLHRIAQLWGHQLMASLGADLPPGEDDAAAPPGLQASHRDWVAHERQATGIADAWRRCFEAWDVVIAPVLPIPAFPHCDETPFEARCVRIDDRVLPYGELGVWAGPASLSGLPATAVPIGRSRDGLPIGAQIIGPRFEDRTPLAFAALLEAAFGGYVAPPGWGSTTAG